MIIRFAGDIEEKSWLAGLLVLQHAQLRGDESFARSIPQIVPDRSFKFFVVEDMGPKRDLFAAGLLRLYQNHWASSPIVVAEAILFREPDPEC